MTKTNNTKSKAGLLIFLAWLVYLTSYLGKVNYSANITQIIDFYQVSKAEAGIAPTMFFFAYGIGQVVNGFLCKKYNIKWVVFISLLASALINLTVAITTNFAIVKWLWLINGFVLSVLWPTLIRLLSESLPQKALGKSSVIMVSTVGCGTIIVYGTSSVFAIFNSFRLSFYLAAFSALIILTVWLILYKPSVNLAITEKEEQIEEKNESNIENTQTLTGNEMKKFQISMGILCFLAVGVNFIRMDSLPGCRQYLKKSMILPILYQYC
ncbi:MAG: MFS transporter [Clostridia bacterium]|nr:MFS transporter [Clostridia bacterium]